MLKYLNPNKFIYISDKLMPYLILVTIALFAIGIYLGLFNSPADYQQGNAVRIMYIHVPSAWMSLFIYSIMAASSAAFLIWRNSLLDILARSSASVGATFTLVTLVTGSLWGKPIWGTWWVWDARLTSELILFFLYMGYIALDKAYGEMEQGAKSLAVLAIVGWINIPIIKFSVNFWSTLHQPASIIRKGGPSIHSSMLTPLLIMFLGSIFYFLTVTTLRMKKNIATRKIARMNINNYN